MHVRAHMMAACVCVCVYVFVCVCLCVCVCVLKKDMDQINKGVHIMAEFTGKSLETSE